MQCFVTVRAVLTKWNDTDAVTQGAEQRTTGGRAARRVWRLTERCCAVVTVARPDVLAELGTEAYVILPPFRGFDYEVFFLGCMKTDRTAVVRSS